MAERIETRHRKGRRTTGAELPPHVQTEVNRILDREARRLLDEGYRNDESGKLVPSEHYVTRDVMAPTEDQQEEA